MSHPGAWSAIVLAGDRHSEDSVVSAAGSCCKAMAKLADQSMLERVLGALTGSRAIQHITVVGPSRTERTKPVLDSFAARYGCQFLEPADGPSDSALQAFEDVHGFPVLLLTCDLPLLTAEMVDHYCQQACSLPADIVAAYVSRGRIAELVPDMYKTVYKSSGHEVCFANLFGVLNSNGLHAIRFWRSIEQQRKNPMAIIKQLGLKNVIRYKMGMLDLEKESEALSRMLSCQATLMESPNAEIAIDVDNAEDYWLMQKYFAANAKNN